MKWLVSILLIIVYVSSIIYFEFWVHSTEPSSCNKNCVFLHTIGKQLDLYSQTITFYSNAPYTYAIWAQKEIAYLHTFSKIEQNQLKEIFVVLGTIERVSIKEEARYNADSDTDDQITAAGNFLHIAAQNLEK